MASLWFGPGFLRHAPFRHCKQIMLHCQNRVQSLHDYFSSKFYFKFLKRERERGEEEKYWVPGLSFYKSYRFVCKMTNKSPQKHIFHEIIMQYNYIEALLFGA